MSLIYCTKCGHLLSTTAPKCPGCGSPPYHPAKAGAESGGRLEELGKSLKDLSKGIFGLLILFVLGAIFYSMVTGPTSTSGPGPEHSRGALPSAMPDLDTWDSIKAQSSFGCVDSTDFEAIINYIRQDDREAARRALAEGLSTGKCIRFEPDEQVFIADVSLLHRLVEVRPKGATIAYWTDVRAVRPDFHY